MARNLGWKSHCLRAKARMFAVCYTYWVKAVLDHVVRLDPVDAANWLEVIADVAAQRADEALAAGRGVEREAERIPAQLRRFL